MTGTRQLHVAEDVDPQDGGPIWAAEPGAWLSPGLRLWRPLSTGLRCETWLGWSTDLWAPVLIKLARPHQCAEPRARRALRREVTALDGLLHPTVPRLYSHELRAPTPFLVEEYVDGRPLDELLRRGRISAAATLTLAAQLLGALVPLHARGLAHLDIKPDNVIIAAGRPVLIDFGSARPIGARQPAGRPVGTAGFASPELESCEPVSAAMDVYGVGALLRSCRPRRRFARAGSLLEDVIVRFTTPDPSDRPDVPTALGLVAEALPRRRRPWPGWVGSELDQRPSAANSSSIPVHASSSSPT